MITGDAASWPVPVMIRMPARLAGLHRNVIVLHGMTQECPPKLDLRQPIGQEALWKRGLRLGNGQDRVKRG